jgi:hypothetical protein
VEGDDAIGKRGFASRVALKMSGRAPAIRVDEPFMARPGDSAKVPRLATSTRLNSGKVPIARSLHASCTVADGSALCVYEIPGIR